MTIGFPVVEILGEVISLVDPFTWRILYNYRGGDLVLLN